MNSEVIVHKSGSVTYAGPDATNFFRAKMLSLSIRMYSETKVIPTRGVTITRMLKMATGYTGKSYRRGQYDLAVEDLRIWIETMRAALPVTSGDSRTP